MTETEVERLVVRLSGDNGEFRKSMGDSVSAMQQAANQIKQSSGNMTTAHVAAGVVIGNVIMAVAHKFRELSRTMIDGYAEAELIEFKLRSALEANGRDVEALMGRYSEFAATMQDLTVVEDDAVMSMLQTAESMGVSGVAAERAVKNAIALAAAKGTSAQAVLRMTMALEQGNATMLQRYIPALRGIKDPAQKAAMAQDFLAKMMKTAMAETETASGKWRRLKIAMGNLWEGYGEVLVKVFKGTLDYLQLVIAGLQKLNYEVRMTIIVVTLLTSSVATLMVAWKPILSVAAQIATVIAGIFTPIGAVVVATGAVITGTIGFMVSALGGWEASWKAIIPVIQQVKNVLVTAFQEIRTIIMAFIGGPMDALGASFLSAQNQWRLGFLTLRAIVIDTLISIEYQITRWQEFVTLACLAVGYTMLKLVNDIDYWWNVQLQTQLVIFIVTFVKSFNSALNEALVDLLQFSLKAQDVLSIFLPSAISDAIGEQIREMLREAQDNINLINQMPIPAPAGPRKPTVQETALATAMASISTNLMSGYKAFREARLKELFGGDEVEKSANKTAKAINKVGDAIRYMRFEAALFNSAEAAYRIEEFMMTGGVGGGEGGGGKAGKDSSLAGPQAAAAMEEAGLDGEMAANNRTLGEIAMSLRTIVEQGNRSARRTTLELAPSEIA